ncbi:hypothetical protein ACP4OV_016679 [Aristida adscensionis]
MHAGQSSLSRRPRSSRAQAELARAVADLAGAGLTLAAAECAVATDLTRGAELELALAAAEVELADLAHMAPWRGSRSQSRISRQLRSRAGGGARLRQ